MLKIQKNGKTKKRKNRKKKDKTKTNRKLKEPEMNHRKKKPEPEGLQPARSSARACINPPCCGAGIEIGEREGSEGRRFLYVDQVGGYSAPHTPWPGLGQAYLTVFSLISLVF
jgi:hypothetical protein